MQGNIPRKRHYAENEALKEAKRLAINNPGVEFFVVEAKQACKMNDPVNVVQLKDIPF